MRFVEAQSRVGISFLLSRCEKCLGVASNSPKHRWRIRVLGGPCLDEAVRSCGGQRSGSPGTTSRSTEFMTLGLCTFRNAKKKQKA